MRKARQDGIDYVEMFYNPKRKHDRNGMPSPVDFERQQKLRYEDVQETRGYSERMFWKAACGFFWVTN